LSSERYVVKHLIFVQVFYFTCKIETERIQEIVLELIKYVQIVVAVVRVPFKSIIDLVNPFVNLGGPIAGVIHNLAKVVVFVGRKTPGTIIKVCTVDISTNIIKSFGQILKRIHSSVFLAF